MRIDVDSLISTELKTPDTSRSSIKNVVVVPKSKCEKNILIIKEKPEKWSDSENETRIQPKHSSTPNIQYKSGFTKPKKCAVQELKEAILMKATLPNKTNAINQCTEKATKPTKKGTSAYREKMSTQESRQNSAVTRNRTPSRDLPLRRNRERAVDYLTGWSGSEGESQRPTKSFSSMDVNMSTNAPSLEDDYTLRRLEDAIACAETAFRNRTVPNSVYAQAGGPQQIKSAKGLNKFLDWLSMCLWRCSPGCQEVPRNK